MKKVIGFVFMFGVCASGFLFAEFHAIKEAKALPPCNGEYVKCIGGNCVWFTCGPAQPAPTHEFCTDIGSSCLMQGACEAGPLPC